MSWPLVEIGKLVEKVSSWNPAKSGEIEPFNYIDLGSVDKDKKVIRLEDVPSLIPSEAPSRARQLVKPDDVLVATVRPNLNGVAKVPNKLEGATASTGYCVLRAKTDELDSSYLYYWVQTLSFVSDMMSKATGANYPAVSDKIIKQSKIPLPPLDEQKRIAAILDKADAIRRKRQQAINLADDFLRSVFLDMFGDPSDYKTVKELLDEGYLLLHKDGNHGSNYPRKNEFVDSGVPFISAKDISDEDGTIDYGGIAYLTEQKAAKLTIGWLEKGDVLLAHNATVGRVGYFDGQVPEAIIGTSLTAFRVNPERMSSMYLFAALKYSKFQKQLTQNMGQSTRNQVPITAQKELHIPLGSMDKQNKFEKLLAQVMTQKSRLLSSANSGEELFNSLSQKAFSGEL